MKFNKILNAFAAVLIGFSCTMGVYAQDDGHLTTDSEKPAVSFDSDGWKKYFTPTRDAQKANITAASTNKRAYQARSLQISGSVTEPVKPEDFTYSKYLTDKDGKKLYPLSGVNGVDPSTIGMEINAANFGLESFDGCEISFTYRFGEGANKVLLQNSAFVFPTDKEYRVLTKTPVQIVYDDSKKDNVGQYGKGVLKVSDKIDSTKIVFELPVCKKTDNMVLFYLDNISVKTPKKQDGKNLYVANVDSYNKGAEPAEINENAVVKNTDKGEEVYGDTSTKSQKLTPWLIGGGVVLGAGLITVAVIAIVKHKKKFY